MPDTNQDRAIGRLEGRLDEVGKKLDSLIRTIESQNDHADAGRQRLFERVGHLETSIEIAGKIDAQLRDEIRGLDQKITGDVMPTINEVKRWKITGMTVLTMVGIAGASIGAFVMWAWDVIVSKWSGGPP